MVVTYESTKTDGGRFRNTEILTFDGDKLSDLDSSYAVRRRRKVNVS